MALPKMRTLPEAAKELKKYDSDTCLTESVLRRMIKSGKLPHVKSGRRILVNLDLLEFILSNPQNSEENDTVNKIRQLA